MRVTPLLATIAALTSASYAQTGDKQCTEYMCITATVNSSTVQYALTSTGKADLGYMAMGFGTQMAGSPMVIMWENSDGTFMLSQRTASGYVMPTVDSNPSRVATLETSASTSASNNVATYTYTIPANSDTEQNVIFAYGNTQPDGTDGSATIVQHLDSGALVLNLQGTLSSSNSSSNSSSSSGSSSGSSSEVSTPLLGYQKAIIAHAILLTVGFLLFLPIGVITARYLRTTTPNWFKGHWIANSLFAGPIILIGFILGFVAVHDAGVPDLSDPHMKWGVAIFALYAAQLFLGAIIHFFKSPTRTSRPPQNYFHAVLGLVIILLAFYQVHNGYATEWVKMAGKGKLPNSVMIVWIVWLVAFVLLYFGGVALFLRKQLEHEKRSRDMEDISKIKMLRMGERA